MKTTLAQRSLSCPAQFLAMFEIKMNTWINHSPSFTPILHWLATKRHFVLIQSPTIVSLFALFGLVQKKRVHSGASRPFSSHFRTNSCAIVVDDIVCCQLLSYQSKYINILMMYPIYINILIYYNISLPKNAGSYIPDTFHIPTPNGQSQPNSVNFRPWGFPVSSRAWKHGLGMKEFIPNWMELSILQSTKQVSNDACPLM